MCAIAPEAISAPNKSLACVAMTKKRQIYCPDREILEAVQNDKYSVNSLYVLGKYMLGRGEKPPRLMHTFPIYT